MGKASKDWEKMPWKWQWGGGTARNARKFQGFRGKQLSLFYKLGYPSYLHGIDGFSFNESFYKDKDRRDRNSLAKL